MLNMAKILDAHMVELDWICVVFKDYQGNTCTQYFQDLDDLQLKYDASTANDVRNLLAANLGD